MSKETVVHPEHYKLNVEFEVIDIIDIVTKGLKGVDAFKIGNVIKYLLRADKKNGLEDLKKAEFYLNGYEDWSIANYSNSQYLILNSVRERINNDELKFCYASLICCNFKSARDYLSDYINDKENENA